MSIQQLRFVERDGKRILQYLYVPDQPANFGQAWFDVPLVMEPLPKIDPSLLPKEN